MTFEGFRSSPSRSWGKPFFVLAVACGLLLAPPARAQHWSRENPFGTFQKTSTKVLAAFRKVVAQPSRSTVRVRCDGKDAALGTVVGADGWILTKASELKGDIDCKLQDGRELEAKLVGKDDRYDLALLKIDARGLQPAAWQSSSVAPVGNWVASPGIGRDPVGVGVVSVAARTLPRRGVFWAVDPSTTGYLGIGLDTAATGARIGQVMPGTAAARAGLKVNDTILAISGRAIKDGEGLLATLQDFKPGDTVKVRVKRGDKELEMSAKLGRRPGQSRSDFQNRLGSQLSKRRFGFPAILQHDTVIKPADCGGPLVDLDGHVIGINIARAGRTESYALPAEAVLPLLADLSGGKLAAPAKSVARDGARTSPTRSAATGN